MMSLRTEILRLEQFMLVLRTTPVSHLPMQAVPHQRRDTAYYAYLCLSQRLQGQIVVSLKR